MLHGSSFEEVNTMVGDYKENVIEGIIGETEIVCTFTQQKFIIRAKKMAKKFPDVVRILTDHDDGSLFCKMPLKALYLIIYGNGGTNPVDEDNQDDADDGIVTE